MVVIAYHRYSNESEGADEDIYDDFKLIKTLWLPCFFIKLIRRFKGAILPVGESGVKGAPDDTSSMPDNIMRLPNDC